jgi:SNF2 family DNA or RNA helicase
MRSLFGSGLELGPNLEEWAWERLAVEKEIHELNTALDFSPGVAYNPKLFGYQKAGAEFLAFTEHCILGDEPGLGKTAQTIAAVKALYEQGNDVLPILIVCPNSIKRTWQDELNEWWPDGPALQIVNGSAAQRRKQLDRATDTGHIVNWESVRLHSRVAGYGSIRLKACAKCGGVENPRPDEEYKTAVTEAKCEVHPREMQAIGYKTVIVDEAHRMKEPNAKQTRAVWSVLHSADYRYLLTGTPVADNVGDLWSLLHGVDPVSFPVKSKFLDTFATTRLNFFGGYEVLGLNPERKETFYRILDGYLRRTPKQLALPQLPPKLPVQYRYAEMSPKQAKQYNQMRDGFITLLDSGEPITAADQLVQFTRLRQFACATGTKGEDGKVHLIEPSCKVDDLADFVECNPKPLVVAAEYREIIELAYARLTSMGIKCGLITGKQTIDERHVTCQEFQKGKLQVVLMTLGAGGVGITLTAADTIYFIERSSSMLANTQGEDRVYRIGSEIHDAVRVVVCIAQDSIEDNREYQLAIKADRFEEVIQDKERARRMLNANGK